MIAGRLIVNSPGALGLQVRKIPSIVKWSAKWSRLISQIYIGLLCYLLPCCPSTCCKSWDQHSHSTPEVPAKSASDSTLAQHGWAEGGIFRAVGRERSVIAFFSPRRQPDSHFLRSPQKLKRYAWAVITNGLLTMVLACHHKIPGRSNS